MTQRERENQATAAGGVRGMGRLGQLLLLTVICSLRATTVTPRNERGQVPSDKLLPSRWQSGVTAAPPKPKKTAPSKKEKKPLVQTTDLPDRWTLAVDANPVERAIKWVRVRIQGFMLH